MKTFDDFDQLLKQSLSPTVEPSEELNRKIINRLKERNKMRNKVPKKMFPAALIATSLIFAMFVTVFAAIHLLNSKQVAEHLGDQTLAQAFDGQDAVEVNELVVSGGYNFTLHGIVSGQGLTDFAVSGQEISPDRTYAVVSIAKQDGSKMTDIQDEEYDEVSFFVSPLIKGQNPWQFNIASMNGGYSEFVIDGVMYRLIDCDGVEIFADRGVYLAISSSNFYDINAFNYNEETGEISLNEDYEGANALFDLPLDITKADPDKAEKYLQQLWDNTEDSGSSEEKIFDWDDELANAVMVRESLKEVTYDEDGLACYEYKNHKIAFNPDVFFAEDQTPKLVSIAEADGERTAILCSKDAEGLIFCSVWLLN
ncbi:hypothetical protein [Candidatus Contubernalis alkaliaceticus]|uniref:hypothetical protein n=1 Tax=Candidatus Contubernalis alkaliaceticus TaxID=338645 RepID=UPI001F4BE3B8|nr:hypothetical protein [Candidatus Contubernalis alkalaceticus]UNC92281.1 hypothetical protein HUE98_09340 [Candidatus Contubernalis alkalaceticus]